MEAGGPGRATPPHPVRAGLAPLPFRLLAGRMATEARGFGSVYDFPASRWHVPDGRIDLTTEHLGERGASPLGPAAGPHTQLAQNIVASWLGGARFVELKTVQERDHLAIPRPCIRVPDVGYNVEWSQELALPDSLREYAKAVYLVEILKATRAFGWMPEGVPLDTVFSASVGYTLSGLSSEPMQRFLDGLAHAAPLFDALRAELPAGPAELAELRDLPLPEALCRTVTLSTFHGCPPAEIEAMALLLMRRGFGVVLKLNPTLGGFRRTDHLVRERLGYHQVRLLPEAFERDLSYPQAIHILRRLTASAAGLGVGFGVKLTNTLVVQNDPALFPTQKEPVMYLSGAPLYVLATELAWRLRVDLSPDLPVAFSAGLRKEVVGEAMAMGLAPLTSCTDLLKPRGYARLGEQAAALAQALEPYSVTSRDAYILAACGRGLAAVSAALVSRPGGAAVWEAACGKLSSAHPARLPQVLREEAEAAGLPAGEVVAQAVRMAGQLNTGVLVPRIPDDARHHAQAVPRRPRKRAKVIARHDCLECDQCRTGCPNLALFSYAVTPVDVTTVTVNGRGGEAGAGFRLVREHQTALLADACNACGSCGLFCPERGEPHEVKEAVFLSRALFDERPERDGYHWTGEALLGRAGGALFTFTPAKDGHHATFAGGGATLRLALPENGAITVEEASVSPGASLDTALVWRFLVIYRGVVQSARPGWLAGPAAGWPGGA